MIIKPIFQENNEIKHIIWFFWNRNRYWNFVK